MLKFNYDFEIHLHHTDTCTKIRIIEAKRQSIPQMMKPEIPGHERKQNKKKQKKEKEMKKRRKERRVQILNGTRWH